MDRRVLRQDGDAALALQLVRVHDALGDPLVGPEDAALVEQRVDERGLAMIDVGDDRDVSSRRVGDFRSGFFEHRHLTSITRYDPGLLLAHARHLPESGLAARTSNAPDATAPGGGLRRAPADLRATRRHGQSTGGRTAPPRAGPGRSHRALLSEHALLPDRLLRDSETWRRRRAAQRAAQATRDRVSPPGQRRRRRCSSSKGHRSCRWPAWREPPATRFPRAGISS